MEYCVEVLVAAPPAVVAAAYADPATWPQWQPGLVSVTPLDGTHGQAGARTVLRFELPGRAMEMIETLHLVQLPHRYDAVYTTGGVTNWCHNEFAPTPDGSTVWTQHDAWAFDDVEADDDDLERFRATTSALMHEFRAWVERGRATRPA